MMQDLIIGFCHIPEVCKIKQQKSCTEKMSNENKSHMLTKKKKKKKCQMSATSAVVSIETDLKRRPHW